MFKTFITEFKHIFKSKWRILGVFILLFIPFIYGFLYMNAYWAPFQHVDKLKIAVVSRDTKTDGTQEDLSKAFTKYLVSHGITAGKNQIYSLVEDQSISVNPEESVDNGKYAAIIVIPKGFTSAMKGFDVAITPTSVIADPTIISKEFEKAVKLMGGTPAPGHKNYDKVTFYFSYKHSYLAGEMANYASNNLRVALAAVFPDFTKVTANLPAPIASMINKMLAIGQSQTSGLVSLTRTGYSHMNTYGMGLAPYFISIALWAGALATLFVVKNERHIKTESTLKHLAGKWLVWVTIAWIQAQILITAITLQGIRIGMDQWQLYAFSLFMATIFPTIVMFVGYSIRYGDIGEFLVVILLVAQLISSSGTFPVEMQNIIFKIIHPVAPFTYTIQALREIMWNPDTTIILKDMAILLIFPAIAIPLSFYFNWKFDKKIYANNRFYNSYEIHMGDY